MKPVALPPGLASVLDKAGANRVGKDGEYNRDGTGRLQQRLQRRGSGRKNDVGRKRNQFRRICGPL